MDHIGTLYLSRKQRPQATRAADGTFALTLLAFERLGNAIGQVEPYLLTWSGAKAEAFWSLHHPDLTPGAVLHVEYDRQRLITTTGRHVQAQVVGSVKSLQVLPKVANAHHKKASSPCLA